MTALVGNAMQEISLPDQILDALARAPDCGIEQLASMLPELTSSQLFVGVRRLSQMGHVRLVLDGRGIVTVRRADRTHRTNAKQTGESEWHRHRSTLRR